MNEAERLSVLRSYAILDTGAEEAFDDLTGLAATLCSTPIALLTLIDEKRQWFKSRRGLVLTETSREIAFCSFTIAQRSALVVEDTHLDPRFAGNPLVTGAPYVRFYAGVPILSPENAALGTIAVLDTKPGKLLPEQLQGLTVLARQAAAQLVLRRKLLDENRQRVVTDQVLEEMLERFRLALELAQIGFWDWNLQTNQVFYSREWKSQLGYSAEEIKGVLSEWESRLHPADAPEVLEKTRAFISNPDPGSSMELRFRLRHKDGSWRHILSRATLVGSTRRLIGLHLDLTEDCLAREQLADQKRFLESLVTNLPGMIYKCKYDPNWTAIYLSQRAQDVTGYAAEDFIEGRVEYGSLIHPEDRQQVWDTISHAIEHHQYFTIEYRIRAASGVIRWVWERGWAIRDGKGEIQALEGFVADITSAKTAALELNNTRLLLEKAQCVGKLGTWYVDLAEPEQLIHGSELCPVFGLSGEHFDGRLQTFFALVHPEDRAKVQETILGAFAQAQPFQLEHRILYPDGRLQWVYQVADVERNEKGEPAFFMGVIQDVTERRNLEEQIRHSQKMEAVGQLAGGVAHDFNNILTVILGHAYQAMRSGDIPRKAGDSIQEIARAAERAATLTRQLLAFSRKQVLEMRPVKLSDVLGGIMKMLDRLLGEHISLEISSLGYLPTVQADAGMIEQVLLNLAVNARDAMPNGGRLIIELGTVLRENPEGSAKQGSQRFARLVVRDTGCGIPPQILPRIFEPFFTTKEAGKGTGLGLAMVYGIIKQHQGWIEVESSEGEGTQFSIHLPVLEEADTPSANHAPEPPPPQGEETVLLVEDEQALRNLTAQVLETNGYSVVTAANGLVALQLWSTHRDSIDLLLTDLVLPEGISGFELAEALQKEKPALKVVYASGYSSEIFEKKTELREGFNFLQKPYHPRKLLETLRHALNRRTRNS